MKWLSWSNCVLGIWLILAPFVLGYSTVRGAVVDDVLLGVIIGGLALWRALGPETAGMRGVSWVVTLAGLWVLVAPFAIGYSAIAAAVGNDVIVGLIVLILGGIRAMTPVRAVAAH